MPTMSGRGWAYIGVTLGGAVSIAANVAHSYVPPNDAPADWTPHAGAVIVAIFWPVALFVAIEILARNLWPVGRRWVALRFGGLSAVALFAAVVSYRHLSGLLTYYGEDTITSTFGPLAVDGLMVMATGALIATGHVAATTRAPEPATVAVTRSATVAVPPPDTTPAKPRASKPPRKTTGTAARVARLRAKQPDITQAAVVAKLGVSERTIQRYWPATAPAIQSVNGTTVLPDTAAPAAT